MRYAVLADIHSNLEALSAVLSALEDKKVDEYVCLGDIVGYGADPAECLRLVREKCGIIVRGNHDSAVADEENLACFTPDAKESVLWTIGMLSDDDIEFLRGLNIKESNDYFLAVHAAPLFPEEMGYVHNVADARDNFDGFDEQICLMGHTHAPAVFTFNDADGSCRSLSEPVTFLSPRMRYIINPGSVGQPRDGSPDASCAVLDTSMREMEIIRTPYDFTAAGKKIIAAGLPERLGLRLGTGS